MKFLEIDDRNKKVYCSKEAHDWYQSYAGVENSQIRMIKEVSDAKINREPLRTYYGEPVKCADMYETILHAKRLIIAIINDYKWVENVFYIKVEGLITSCGQQQYLSYDAVNNTFFASRLLPRELCEERQIVQEFSEDFDYENMLRLKKERVI